jgi:hypothetical protein
MIGQRFERLVVVGEASPYVSPSDGWRRSRWLCRCDCGKEVVAHQVCLQRGSTRSCGCYRKGRPKSRTRMSHGQAAKKDGKRSGTYIAWVAMRGRCHNPNRPEYERYGGRGITVCQRWEKFENFLEDMGKRPKGKSIDRIDNDGNYEPGNCRWADNKTQARNRHYGKRIEFYGRQISTAELLEITGVPRTTFYKRLKRGMTPQQAVSMC